MYRLANREKILAYQSGDGRSLRRGGMLMKVIDRIVWVMWLMLLAMAGYMAGGL